MPVSHYAMHSASTSDQRRIKITNHLIGGRLVIKQEIYIQTPRTQVMIMEDLVLDSPAVSTPLDL
jgi:hypothetical protein